MSHSHDRLIGQCKIWNHVLLDTRLVQCMSIIANHIITEFIRLMKKKKTEEEKKKKKKKKKLSSHNRPNPMGMTQSAGMTSYIYLWGK